MDSDRGPPPKKPRPRSLGPADAIAVLLLAVPAFAVTMHSLHSSLAATATALDGTVQAARTTPPGNPHPSAGHPGKPPVRQSKN